MLDLSKDQWKEQTAGNPNAVLVDVRTLEEVEEGIIPGALHQDIFDPQGFMEFIDGLDKSKEYYMYCRSGGRSGQACQIMDQAGFEKTFNLVGGFSNWDGEVGNL